MAESEAKTTTRRPVFSRLYPAMARAMDRAGMSERRHELLAGLSGRVLEVGAGDGATFAGYPASVERVLAIEPEPRLRALAERAAQVSEAGGGVPVEVSAGIAEQLPAPDHSVDAVVFALVLCSVRDQAAALAEAARVLRPGGQVRFLEHVRAEGAGLVRVQKLLDATFWPRLAGGCHTGRDTLTALRRAGFTITRVERFLLPPARTPFSFFVLGTAIPSRDAGAGDGVIGAGDAR
jgi:ubiquinone/menaquinone biosynthesis C-methylase UbiE